MKMFKQMIGFVAVAGLALVMAPAASAQIFSESFDALSGTVSVGAQDTTTHDLTDFANLANWSKSGRSAIHGVDTANWTGNTGNPRNWGVMIFGGRTGQPASELGVITQTAGNSGSNDNGTQYVIDFLAAAADWGGTQWNDTTTDGIKIEVLRASDNAVLHTFTQVTGAPVGVGDLGLTAYSFNYTGDGTGDIKFRITGINAQTSRFNGTIDDLTLSVVTATPGTLIYGK